MNKTCTTDSRQIPRLFRRPQAVSSSNSAWARRFCLLLLPLLLGLLLTVQRVGAKGPRYTQCHIGAVLPSGSIGVPRGTLIWIKVGNTWFNNAKAVDLYNWPRKTGDITELEGTIAHVEVRAPGYQPAVANFVADGSMNQTMRVRLRR